MDKLLSPEIIQAAASSTLGILSLMCLITGIVVLTLFKDSPVWAKLIVFTIIFFGVSGFAYAILNQQSLGKNLEATRQFFIGSWQVEQSIGSMKGATFTDYFENGSFSSEEEVFMDNGVGRRVLSDGRWSFDQLTKDKFRLTLYYPNRTPWVGTFKVIDHDRIHNINQNYDAVRVSK